MHGSLNSPLARFGLNAEFDSLQEQMEDLANNWQGNTHGSGCSISPINERQPVWLKSDFDDQRRNAQTVIQNHYGALYRNEDPATATFERNRASMFVGSANKPGFHEDEEEGNPFLSDKVNTGYRNTLNPPDFHSNEYESSLPASSRHQGPPQKYTNPITISPTGVFHVRPSHLQNNIYVRQLEQQGGSFHERLEELQHDLLQSISGNRAGLLQRFHDDSGSIARRRVPGTPFVADDAYRASAGHQHRLEAGGSYWSRSIGSAKTTEGNMEDWPEYFSRPSSLSPNPLYSANHVSRISDRQHFDSAEIDADGGDDVEIENGSMSEGEDRVEARVREENIGGPHGAVEGSQILFINDTRVVECE
ncbi:hypothetical protein HK097_000408 [Rhizophlyctis rosea]|uniref:Uncharacterized protein n=1 Tax=Rhizophlyctis rosea TaxID=64517 RepID=A0AAD5S5N5_9FUNG|nr:hypothetical protein HK097_000408 [Rhizophlyctis rosea]